MSAPLVMCFSGIIEPRRIKDALKEELRIVSDHVGTPIALIDIDSGEVVAKYSFDEWGVELSDPPVGYRLPFGLAGGIYDPDTKLVRFGHREYSPLLGQWLSKDPILFAGGDTNLYGYVANDPINFFDPDGLKKTFVYQSGNLSLYGDNGGQLFSGPAVSGPYGNGSLPQGRYSVGGMRDNRSG